MHPSTYCMRLACPSSTPSRPLARTITGVRSSVRLLRSRVTRAADEDGNGEVSGRMESLFMEELKKRGINSPPDAQSARNPLGSEKAPPSPRNPFDVQRDAERALTEGQLARSRALQSEGLEGLIPRARALLTLGTTFFLSFGPLIAAVIVFTGGIFVFFGDAFVHGGRPGSGMPAYVDPYDLLNEPTYDPMVPMRPSPPPPVQSEPAPPVRIGANPDGNFL